MHLGPGQLWSRNRAYTCDGAVVAITWDQDGDQRIVKQLEVEQMHDINMARHRTRNETREHLRRCLRALTRDGALITADGEIYPVAPANVRAARNLTLHAFHRPERKPGPFYSAPPEETPGG